MSAEQVGQKVWVMVQQSNSSNKIMIGLYGGRLAMGPPDMKFVSMVMPDGTQCKFSIHNNYIGNDELDLLRKLLRARMGEL